MKTSFILIAICLLFACTATKTTIKSVGGTGNKGNVINRPIK